MANRGVFQDSSTGAALIVDAEGSTALSARLQPYGTAGAEAFADILSAIFRPMVDRVLSEGGSVAELAGDGIVAVFPGDPEVAVGNAIAAAAAIMADLDSLSDFETPDGPASMTVRSVVGAGSIEWVIWSSSNNRSSQNAAYASVGSALEEARRGEPITPGGVISMGPAAAAHLPADVATQELSEGFHAILDPAATQKTPREYSDEPEVSTGQLTFYPDEVTDVDLRGEFRDVVAVFVEVSNPDSMEQVLATLSHHRGYLNHVTKPHAERRGIESFVLWGAPTSREHDIGYALRFLDDLRSEYSTDMRAGVTQSTAFAGFIGSQHQEVYTAIGPGVNLAARICSSAEWGEIVIDQNIRSQLSDPWGVEDIGEHEYRGFSAPVPTSRITFVPPVRTGDPHQGSIIGRSNELDQLEDFLAPLWSGHAAGVIAVAGDPGIGKSRLIGSLEERLSARNPPPVWITARADEIRTQPLATLEDALASYFGKPGREESGERLDAYLAELIEGTPDIVPELSRTRKALGDLLHLAADVEIADKLDPKTRFDNLVIAVANLVEAIEKGAPVIIVIADGQWLDSGTAEVFSRLIADHSETRLAIVIETRDPDSGMEHDHIVQVGPMSESQIGKLSAEILGESASPELISAVTERSGGNPFFAQQLLDYFRRSESVSDRSSGKLPNFDDDVPLDMRRLLVARLDGLAGAVRRMVQTASVLGRDIDLQVLEQMSAGTPDFENHVQSAIGAGIWDRTDDQHVTFSNLLIRDAAYGMLLHSDTRSLHAAAAAAIETTAQPGHRNDAELAYHHDRAGNAAVAADFYVGAGEMAAQRYDNQQAHAHLDRALELLPDDDKTRRYAALRAQHDVFEVEGDRPSQEDAISAMEELVPSDDTESAIDVALLRSRLMVALGRYQEAREIVDQAIPLAADPNLVAQRGQLTFLQADLARYLGRTEDAVSLANTAKELFIQAEDVLRVAHAEDLAGGLAWESGDFETAVELHRSAAEAFGAAGQVIEETRALNNMGTAMISIGDYAKAREIHWAGAQRSHEIGYRMGEGDHLDNMGGTAWAIGDLTLALEYYNKALEIRRGMDDAWGTAISLGNLGGTHRAMGNPEDALALYREAFEIDERIGRLRGQGYDLHGIGLCHLDLGRYNLATEALGRSASIRDELGEAHLANESHIACAVAMLRRGDQDSAVELVEAVLAEEGDDFFAGAVETTATRLRCIEVLEVSSPEIAEELRQRTAEGVLERAKKISDPEQRQSYLERVESHSQAIEGD